MTTASLSTTWKRACRLLPILLVIIALMLPAVHANANRDNTASQSDQNNAETANKVLVLVNQWRLEQGVPLLKVNKTLEQMAIAQAQYIKPLIAGFDENDEAAYHRDGQGHTPPQRAVVPPYNWPQYGRNRSAQIEIGENAAVGALAGAIAFWKSSSIHAKAALNPVYREVGVAAIPHPYGYVFIMDFGARPNIFTALISADGGTLYLTNERSTYSSLRADATQIRIFSADGTPLTDTMPYQSTFTVPQAAVGSNMFVLYTNGNFQMFVPVNVNSDLAALSIGQKVAAVSTSIPSSTPHPTLALPTATQIPTSTPTLESTGETVVVDQPTPTKIAATSAPLSTVQSGTADLTITYNNRSLFILNSSTKPVNLTGFSIGGSGSRVAIETFAATSSFPVSAFPVGHCLQIELVGGTDPAPSACRFVRSIVNVSSPKAFWTQGTFTVTQKGIALATCEATTGRCTVAIPVS